MRSEGGIRIRLALVALTAQIARSAFAVAGLTDPYVALATSRAVPGRVSRTALGLIRDARP